MFTDTALRSLIPALLMLLLLPGRATLGGDSTVASPDAVSPTPADLKSLEARATNAIRRVRPAVVAVNVVEPEPAPAGARELSRSGASGVIISRDGLILSQQHVSHVRRRTDEKDVALAPGSRIYVAMQDGRRLKAELLGSDPLRDLSLLRIVEPGEYPFAELARPGSVRTGDPVIKLGHPGGYRADRGATARFGRVLYTGASIEIVADCLTFGGDSGGPLIDLDGHVVGIIESGAAPQLVIFSFPPRCGNPTCYTGVTTLNRLMPVLLHAPPGPDPDADVPLKDRPAFQEMMRERRKDLYGDVDAKVLSQERWSQGAAERVPWNGLTSRYAGLVVEVLGRQGRRVAYGTVVGADGWILTKASEIPDDPRCRLVTGQILPARVAGVDAPYDVALLKVDAPPHGLPATEWDTHPVRSAGQLLAAPDGRGGSIGVGMVSVAQRTMDGPFPAVVTKAGQYVPKPLPQPLLLGRRIEGKGVVVSRVKAAAALAGIAPGDLLLKLNGQAVGDDDLDRLVDRSSPGDLVPMVIEHAGQTFHISLELQEDPYIRCPGATAWYRNLRADDFPTVFEHDIPLTLDECGGPLIDLDGHAVGLTIARVGQHGCMAIPADVIPALVTRLKKGG